MKFLLPLLLITACMSCSPPAPAPKSGNPPTTVFGHYLESTFGKTIGKAQHDYLLVPRLSCAGCVQRLLNDFAELHPDSAGLTFITSRPDLLPETVKSDYAVWTDTRGQMDRLNLRIENVTLIKTLEGKVLLLKPFLATDTVPVAALLH